MPDAPTETSSVLRDLTRRLRVIEERYTNIRKNIQVNEQNMLATNKKLMTEVKTVSMEVSDIKKGFHQLKEEINMIVHDLRETAKKEEVKILEKYIKLWEPLNFVTRQELEAYAKKKQ